jgi:membrane-associated phospholipid phosphatase
MPLRGNRSLAVSAIALACTITVSRASAQIPARSNPQDLSADIRDVDVRTFLPNVLDDQKRIFTTFPNQLVHRKHWIPVLAIAAATSCLIVADQYDTRYFRRTTNLNGYNSVFSSTATTAGILAVPAGFYTAGYLRGDNSAKQTGLLAAEAALDGEIVDIAAKFVSDRRRPSSIPEASNYADSFTEGKNHFDGSFPSGHAIAAFSVATVVARRYGPQHRWMPFVAYGLAAAVGFSRVSTSSHFPSDVFFGAAIGYGIGRFAVLHQ